MSRAVLSLGSNLGDRAALLRGALEHLSPWVRFVSGCYETAPWGGVVQDDFLNLVAVVADPQAGPRDWLVRAQECERAAGRARPDAQRSAAGTDQPVRWGPRSLDVDVLVVDDGDGPVVSDDPELTLPHPRLHERGFVLLPWAEIEPAARVPGRGDVATLLSGLPEAERAGVRWCGPEAAVVRSGGRGAGPA